MARVPGEALLALLVPLLILTLLILGVLAVTVLLHGRRRIGAWRRWAGAMRADGGHARVGRVSGLRRWFGGGSLRRNRWRRDWASDRLGRWLTSCRHGAHRRARGQRLGHGGRKRRGEGRRGRRRRDDAGGGALRWRAHGHGRTVGGSARRRRSTSATGHLGTRGRLCLVRRASRGSSRCGGPTLGRECRGGAQVAELRASRRQRLRGGLVVVRDDATVGRAFERRVAAGRSVRLQGVFRTCVQIVLVEILGHAFMGSGGRFVSAEASRPDRDPGSAAARPLGPRPRRVLQAERRPRETRAL